MIVRLVQAGWEVIHQPAHALLAAQIAGAWREDERPERWTALIAAVAQHDDNQPPFEGGRHLTDLGAPRGFTVSKSESDVASLEQPKRTLAQTERQGAFVALMAAMHFEALYGGRRDRSDEMRSFLDELAEKRRRWRRALSLPEAEAASAYAIMGFADRLSLTLCGGEVPAAGRRLEIAPLPCGEPCFLHERGDGTLALEPWPFERGEVEVGVEVRPLPRLRFGSDEELERALEEATPEERRWTFRKG